MKLSESVLRDFFNKRLEALQKHETPHLVPDLENMTVVSAEKYLVFHIPFLPQSGANQQWAHEKDSPEYKGLSDKVSSAPDTQEIGDYLHGLIPEKLDNIMSEGRMRSSTVNLKAGTI